MTEITSQQSASWRDYYEMCKPRVVMLMILTSVVGMLLAVPGMVPLDVMILGNLGIAYKNLGQVEKSLLNNGVVYRQNGLRFSCRCAPLPKSLDRGQAVIDR